MRQNPNQTEFARQLRQKQTEAEKILWRALRNRRLQGLKFRRQTPVGPFVADFYCADHKLIVETDGGQHAESGRDQARDGWLAAQGFRVLRFGNIDIRSNLPGVLQRIAEEAER